MRSWCPRADIILDQVDHTTTWDIDLSSDYIDTSGSRALNTQNNEP